MPRKLRNLLNLLKAAADPTRLRLLALLVPGELTVGEITHIYRTTWIFGRDGTFSARSSHKVGLSANSSVEEGTYKLDGYTLELRFKDGTVQRRYVYLWGNKDDNIVIGGRTYSRPR